MTTTAAPAMETYTATGFIEYPSTTVSYQWVTTRPSSTARSSSNSSQTGGVSVTLLAVVLVGVGLLALAMAAWSRWAFLTRNALVRERMIAEEWARGGERRAKREALAKLIPPKLVEVWKEEGGRFLDLKSPRKLPLSLDFIPSTATSSSHHYPCTTPDEPLSLHLSVLILPPLPPPSFNSAPNPDAFDNEEEDLPEVQLGTTPVGLLISSSSEVAAWEEISRTLEAERKRRRTTAKFDAPSSPGVQFVGDARELEPMELESEDRRLRDWWTRRRLSRFW
ncbi:hypothetical protein BDY24DRAFT_444217 [Mrakia frigida]|uniref:uncharacterized protein n=1 Tax=Mrakia frigida TaxID=29902 RepID=UPI003FCC1709